MSFDSAFASEKQ